MRKALLTLVLLVLAAACGGGESGSDDVEVDVGSTGTATPDAPADAPSDATATDDALTTEAAGGDAAGGEFTTALTGANEVPGPGDEAAMGEATVTLGEGEVCVTYSSDLAEAGAMHIHQGTADVAGEVVIDLAAVLESGDACAEAEQSLIDEIAADPAGFYVNVHNGDFPDGAIRGQLA